MLAGSVERKMLIPLPGPPRPPAQGRVRSSLHQTDAFATRQDQAQGTSACSNRSHSPPSCPPRGPPSDGCRMPGKARSQPQKLTSTWTVPAAVRHREVRGRGWEPGAEGQKGELGREWGSRALLYSPLATHGRTTPPRKQHSQVCTSPSVRPLACYGQQRWAQAAKDLITVYFSAEAPETWRLGGNIHQRVVHWIRGVQEVHHGPRDSAFPTRFQVMRDGLLCGPHLEERRCIIDVYL